MRNSISLRFLALFALLTSLLAGISPTSAQTAYAVRINAVEVIEDTDVLLLNTYFTLFDNVSGDVITNARINSAEITFVDEQAKNEAILLQPDTPFYIALVLDTSGSMTGAAAALRNAALEAIKSPPAGARFAIMTFNEQFDVLQEFLDIRNTDPLERAISKVQPVPNAGTCLYDAAYSAIAELERAPKGRRAVILFTDGKDEVLGGDPCSKHSYADVIEYATRGDINVPIHTIGMAGRENAINSNELKNMALTTGGFSKIGTQENLAELFKGIMEVLKSQWLAQAKLYPSAGTYNVLLRLKLDDGSIISQPLTFTATRNYTAPLPPFNLALEGVTYKSDQTGYLVDLAMVSPQRAQSLAISVWDKKSGLKVQESQHQNLSPKTSILVPSDQMANGSDYELRFTVYGPDGQPIANAEGETPFLVHEFRHEVGSTISIDTVTVEGQELLARLQVQNGQEISKYEAWLVNEDSNVQVQGSQFTVDALENEPVLRVPMINVPAGKYQLVVRALDRAGKPAASVNYEGINYTPPPPPGFFKTMTGALVKNPLILISILLILLLIVGWLVISSLRSRSMTATPILQSSLPAVSMKAGKELPISQTMITPRGQPPAPVVQPVARAQTIATPSATLRILESVDFAWMGKTCTINRLPFTIGRKDCDLSIENDQSISHKHATITFDERQNLFMITDTSRNGILLAGQRIAKEIPTRLNSGTVVGIGPRTTVIFEINK